MSNEKKEKYLHSLISIEDFKAILGIDDREDRIVRFCLVTATYTIEQFCMRRFLRKKYFERIEYSGDLVYPLREYPVIAVNSVEIPHPCGISTLSFYDVKTPAKAWETAASMPLNNGKKIDPRFYRVMPDIGTDVDFPFSIEFSPEIRRWRGLKFIKVVYKAGYTVKKVPADLASACLELAAWNMAR